MCLSDSDGRPRAVLSARQGGAPSFRLTDPRGEPRVELSLSETGAPSLVLEDEHGAIFQAPVSSD